MLRRSALAAAKASPCAWSGPKPDPRTVQRVADHFIEQAGWNADLGSPFTAALLREMHGDLLTEGPIHHLCADWPGDPRKDALGLRVLGALHYAVLAGMADDLAAVFPGRVNAAPPDRIWPLARRWLMDNLAFTRSFLQSPPQTNETRRSIAMLPGFLRLAAQFDMPLHLLELGASAGLNQCWDQYAYSTKTWQHPVHPQSNVLISTDWRGPRPQDLGATFQVGERAACDLRPIDILDPAQAMRLKSYTWPDQPERLSRLDAAIAIARDAGVRVDQAPAGDWLADKLANRPRSGVAVVYHSVFLVYPPAEEIQRIMDMIAAAGAQATAEAPVAWLSYESRALFGGRRDQMVMDTRLQVWPGGEIVNLGSGDGHVTYFESASPAE